jgi:EAL domain-containing protein (putative c-di-GMP-specific phosphodiesterase class I)
MTRSLLLDRILGLNGIRAAYQPIVQYAGGSRFTHAFEGLSRGPCGTNVEKASILFEYARQKGEEPAVDLACAREILRGAGSIVNGTRLHINVHASTLDRDIRFAEALVSSAKASGFPVEKLTVEIVEHNASSDSLRFLHALERLREYGIRIALDDVGLGQSNFRMILDSRPDYLKIDRYFVHGCARDAGRQTVIGSIASLAQGFDAQIIAEGVENVEDIDYLRRRGVTMYQGFYLSRPFPSESIATWLAGGQVSKQSFSN